MVEVAVLAGGIYPKTQIPKIKNYFLKKSSLPPSHTANRFFLIIYIFLFIYYYLINFDIYIVLFLLKYLYSITNSFKITVRLSRNLFFLHHHDFLNLFNCA